MTALGLGTFAVRAVERAARTACAAGAPWIDTAPAYARGRAHEALRPVLADHPAVRVATKIGAYGVSQGRAAAAAGVLPGDQAVTGHSLAPWFIRWQTLQSAQELGRAPDMVFVQYPELVGPDRAAVHAGLRGAFAVLEELAQEGLISGYGVSTWWGLTSQAFTVPGILRLAREAAGSPEHAMTGLQMPLNLAGHEQIREALDGQGPLTEAHDAGLTTFGASPLSGGGLLRAMQPGFASRVRPGLSVAAACVLAAASCPGLDVVLLSASTRAHWDDAAAPLARPLPPSHLREILYALASP
ncbi:aldo/keto reductase [Streptomyces sp. NPDC051162]|uniref:aldo/keto reductase n=1 Tax=Streptomyces sp. NPDC051162 TaxID=3154747 RepID=UPI00343A1EFE